MKKISLILTTALALGAFASCCQDKDPIYQRPAEGSLVLNVPVLQDQYIDLTEGNVIELVTSQPDYGYSAVAEYEAQMSLDEDFNTYFDLSNINVNLARMTFKEEDIAQGFCELMGLDSEDAWNAMYPDGAPYTQIYFRATCQLAGVEGSYITSNVVAFNYMKPYFAVAVPGYIYLVGNPEGWVGPDEANAAHYAPWRLFEPENAIGSKVYVGVFDLPAAPMFRFYTALTGWDADSYGYIVDDNATDFELVDGSFTEKLIHGKGAFNFPNFGGGTVTITVNMADENNMTFSMQTGDEGPALPSDYVYMVGNNGGWAEPVAGAYDDWKLEGVLGSGIYSATFDFTEVSFEEQEGNLYCRFYKELNGWGAAEWSSDAAGGNVTVQSGVAAPTFPGEGCFVIPAAGHKIQVDLNTNLDQATFTYVD